MLSGIGLLLRNTNMLRNLMCCRRLLTSVSRCSQLGLDFHKEQGILPPPQVASNLGRPHAVCKSFQSMVHTLVSEVAVETAKVTDAGGKVEITWNNGAISRFHAVWLRHHCRCVECYSISSNQRSLNLDELALDVLILNATLLAFCFKETTSWPLIGRNSNIISYLNGICDNPGNLLITRPVINLNREKEIIGVYWSPMAFSELQIAEEDVLEYCRAKQLFARAISNFHIKNVVRLQPGDIVAFNNRRMAHGRNELFGSGERHLQGCYINICKYKSRLIDLAKKYGDTSSIKRVGNMDWM